MRKKTITKCISVLLALVVWQLAAMSVGSDMLLASPLKVLARLAVIWKEPGFWSTVLFSFLRISAGFLAAFAAGVILGIAAGHWRVLEILLRPYVVTIKAVPVASFIILCLLWMNFNRLTILIAFLIAFPVIYSNVLQGIRSTDVKMQELVKIYHVPRLRRLIYVDLPAVKPFLLSAAGTAVGMAWKAGVAAEVIGLVDGSIGDMLYQAKIYFRNADLLCWTILIVLLSVLSEKLFVLILKNAFRAVERR